MIERWSSIVLVLSALGCSSSATNDDPATGGASGSSAGGVGGGGGASGTGNNGNTGGASGSGGSVDAGALSCPTGLSGPELITVDDFCIDATEVTAAQYQDFLTDAVPTNGQPTECLVNDDFTPDPSCPVPFNPGGSGDVPVVCVDWCDAHAYCKWAGKHLCGAKKGANVPPAQWANSNVDEWFHACTEPEGELYPYGADYFAANCVVWPATAPQPVTDFQTCEHWTFLGLYHLSGNAAEWENSCTTDTNDCGIRGGSYKDEELDVSCAGSTGSAKLLPRLSRMDSVGFRCCADPVPN